MDGVEIAFTFGTAVEAYVLSPYTLDLPFETDTPSEGSQILVAQRPLILVG